MKFHDPQLLLLLLLLIPWAWLRWKQERRRGALPLYCEARFAALPDTFRSRCARHLPWLRVLTLALAILALARPQAIERETTVRSEGVDLVVALDLSTSMLAEELGAKPPRKNRLTMAKEVLAEFMRVRQGDRVGLIVFAGRPYQAAPLTLDHEWLRETIAGLKPGVVEDGTALGDAILAAVNRLRGQASSSRAVILVTDGRNNAGDSDPNLAAAAAKAMGIRVHAIGIGARGPVVVPIDDPLTGTLYRQVDADLDETTLRNIATTTGGAYFRADDSGVLTEVFREIDRLEKRPIEEIVHFTHREWFPALLLGMLVLGMIELFLGATMLRRLWWMYWAATAYAWLAILALPAAALLAHARRQRRRDMPRLTGNGAALSKFFGAEAWLLTAVSLLLVVALCRPQWGQVDVRRESRGIDIIVALDVSRSMLADDLVPTRLAAARQAVIGLLPRLRGDRIGLIAFAGSAFLLCPLTRDYDTLASALREADTAAVPLGGTSLAAALIEAKRAFGATEGRSKALLLISDGEDHGTDALAAANSLHAAGVTVHGIAVGTSAGGLVPLANGAFLKDRQGALVRTRVQPGLLDEIASATGGRRVDLATTPTALNGLYATELSALERRDITATRRQLAERFQIPLALALLLLLLEPFVAIRVSRR